MNNWGATTDGSKKDGRLMLIFGMGEWENIVIAFTGKLLDHQQKIA